MTKVSVYVITYENEERLNQNINAFFETTKDYKDNPDWTFNYNIINNHPHINIWPEHKDKPIEIFHNTLRPINSCGHLTRDYNAALMHGFGSLIEPVSDWVIHVHDDSIWNPNWVEALSKIHETYSFYAGNFGCSFCSYTVDAVKKIGLWDERFINIGIHEGDYFLRALIYNKEKSSINDHHGNRLLNLTQAELFFHPDANERKMHHIHASYNYHYLSLKVFEEKWGIDCENWKIKGTDDNPPKVSLIKNYMFYPYFERHVEGLADKNYLIGGDIT